MVPAPSPSQNYFSQIFKDLSQTYSEHVLPTLETFQDGVRSFPEPPPAKHLMSMGPPLHFGTKRFANPLGKGPSHPPSTASLKNILGTMILSTGIGAFLSLFTNCGGRVEDPRGPGRPQDGGMGGTGGEAGANALQDGGDACPELGEKCFEDARKNCEPGVNPPSGQDSDGDGIPDKFEDRNHNCLLDQDESDPFDPDTDNDGISDFNDPCRMDPDLKCL